MPSYTWLQAIRVLAGREPGHPYVPSTARPILEVDPPRLKEMLAAGIGTVEGIPHDGDMHVPIAATAWRRIRIEFRQSDSKECPLNTLAIVPGKLLPDILANAAWHDLRISAEDVSAIAAEAVRSEAQQPIDGDEQPADGAAVPIALIRELVSVTDAADQIAALNHPISAEHIFSRLRRSIERGPLHVVRDAEGGDRVLAPDLGDWCVRRCLQCPEEWEPPEGDVPLDQQTEIYVPITDAVYWIAHHAEDATESADWAYEKELLPRLQKGDLTAIGRENGAGTMVEILKPAWVKSECFYLHPEGGELRPVGRRGRDVKWWDSVQVPRDDILNAWPTALAPAVPLVSISTGRAGRPTPANLVRAEIERQAASGRVWRSKAECGREMSAWLAETYSHLPRLKPNTIRLKFAVMIPAAEE